MKRIFRRAGAAGVASLWLLAGCSPQGQQQANTQQDPERERQIQAMLAAPRPIAAGHSYWIEELTWMEVRDLIADGVTTAIIPTGGIEQNGPYVVTGKHDIIIGAICPEIAAQLGDALCAPVVEFVPEGNIDPPSGAMRFPGSISLRDETYQALLTDIAASLKQSGFTDIVLIGDSGGNQTGMEIVADQLNKDWVGAGVRAHFIHGYYDPGWEDTERFSAEQLGVEETRNDGYHDDIWVNSMIAAVDPEMVRYQQRVDASLASINGVSLEPLERTVEWGDRMIQFRAETTAQRIRKAIAESQ